MVVTTNVATEQAKKSRALRAADRERERKAQEAEIQRESNENVRVIHEHRAAFSRKYRAVVSFVGALCATVLAPWLLGLKTRDSGFRAQSSQVFDSDIRQNSAYFLSDWSAGCFWILLAGGIVLALMATYALQRWRSGLSYAVMAGLVLAGAWGVAVASAGKWAEAESASARALTWSLVPSNKMFCPGTPIGDEMNPSGGLGGGYAEWKLSVRRLTDVDKSRTAKLGLCVYSGWNYVDTVSLGTVSESSPGALTESEAPAPVVSTDGTSAGFMLVKSQVDRNKLIILGFDFAKLRDPRLKRFPPYLNGATVGKPDVADFITMHGSWQVTIPSLSNLNWSKFGTNLLVGPNNPEYVHDLQAVTLTGSVKTVWKNAFWGSYLLVGDGPLYVVTGSTPKHAVGSSFIRIDPNLKVIWRSAPCSRGTYIVSAQYFWCGLDGSKSHLDLDLETGSWHDAK